MAEDTNINTNPFEELTKTARKLKGVSTLNSKISAVNNMLTNNHMQNLFKVFPSLQFLLGQVLVILLVKKNKGDLISILQQAGLSPKGANQDSVTPNTNPTEEQVSQIKSLFRDFVNGDDFKALTKSLEVVDSTTAVDIQSKLNHATQNFQRAGVKDPTVTSKEEAESLFIKIWDAVWPEVTDKVKGYEDANRHKLTVVAKPDAEVKVGKHKYKSGETIVFSAEELLNLLTQSDSFKKWAADRRGISPKDEIELELPFDPSKQKTSETDSGN